MNISLKAPLIFGTIFIFTANTTTSAAVIKPITQETQQNRIVQARSHFSFNLNIAPEIPYYPPVYPEYYAYPPVYGPVYSYPPVVEYYHPPVYHHHHHTYRYYYY